MIKLFKIDGNSLYPSLKDGERVICLRVFSFSKIRINDIIVFFKAPHGLMIKKVTAIKDNQYYVEGTDPMSIDSRNFGLINFQDIRYKLIPWFRRKT